MQTPQRHKRVELAERTTRERSNAPPKDWTPYDFHTETQNPSIPTE